MRRSSGSSARSPHALRNEEDYIFGLDMGTDEACMAWVKDEIGRAVGLPAALGGIPLDEIAAPYCKLDLKGARVVIQGFGAVGKHAALSRPDRRRRRRGLRLGGNDPQPSGPRRLVANRAEGCREQRSRSPGGAVPSIATP